MKNIDPKRWQRIESLLDEALDLDVSEREAHVRKKADGDEELIGQVLQMLQASERADTFLDNTNRSDLEEVLARMSSAVEEDSDGEPDLERAGPYRLVRKLGRGGMGQVFLGVRDDEAYKRYVAVKVIRRGMDTEDILNRFRVERRILASLNHPGIAQLLDGGATDDGVSYFVMEYVDGDPITKYCDENRLALQDRLHLFQKVCAAVHYAHQNLIVHRDLKPSNILVTKDGTVKLLDFGIAKFLNPDLTGYTVPMTRTEQRVMTPEYASPEQVRGNSLTTASDVYQLGVLLYELLTGHRPFTFQTRVQGEIEKIILEQPPEKPSTMISRVETATEEKTEGPSPEMVSTKRRTALTNLRKQLSGDLDRIVLMALRKEMDRRYQSADQLQLDIANYLGGRPVSAQDDTLGYRVGKFVQRNKVAVGFASVVAVLLVVTTVLALWSATVTERQRQQIAIEAEKSREVVNFLVDLFEKADPEYSQGRDLTVREMVDIGAEDVRERLAEHPEVQSEMMRVLSLVYAGLGEEEDGMALAEAAYNQQMTLSGEEESPELAAALFAMGVLKDDVGETESSREFHERALAMRIRLFGESHADVAQSLNALGVTLFYGMGNIDSARVVWEQALDIRRELLGPSHRDIAESLSNLGAAFGELYYQSGRTDEDLYLFDLAEDYFTEALEMTRRERGELHPFYASNLHNYGLTLMDRGVLQEAENKFEEAIEKRTLIYGRVNNYTANSINMMGRVRQQQGRLEEAAPYFQESFDIHVQLQGPRSATVGIDHTILGGLDRDLGNLEQAVGHFLEGFSILQEALGPENVRTVRAARDLGKILEDLSRFQESERYLQVAVNAIGDEGSSNAMQVSDLISLARVQMLNGRRQAAEGHLAAAEAWLAENPDEELSAQIEAIRGS
jgi:serine/threonine-protein kinase